MLMVSADVSTLLDTDICIDINVTADKQFVTIVGIQTVVDCFVLGIDVPAGMCICHALMHFIVVYDIVVELVELMWTCAPTIWTDQVLIARAVDIDLNRIMLCLLVALLLSMVFARVCPM